MKSIIIPFENDKYIAWLVDLLKEHKMPYHVVQDSELNAEIIAVRTRLNKKYEQKGNWKDMNEEAREDAVLGI